MNRRASVYPRGAALLPTMRDGIGPGIEAAVAIPALPIHSTGVV